MKIARASAEDLEAALDLLGLLDTVSKGYYPSNPDGGDNDPLMFDEDQTDHLRALWNRLKECLDRSPGFQGRVIFGGVTLLDPRNKIINEAADSLELHPSLRREEAAATSALKANTAGASQSSLDGWTEGPPAPRDDGGLAIVELRSEVTVDGQEHGGMPIIVSRWSGKLRATAGSHRIAYEDVVRHIDIASAAARAGV